MMKHTALNRECVRESCLYNVNLGCRRLEGICKERELISCVERVEEAKKE